MKWGGTGIPWYQEADYQTLRRIFADGDRLHATYAGWRAAAEVGERQLLQRGERVVRVEVYPDVVLAWCKERNLAPDARARGRYVSEVTYITHLEEEAFAESQAEVLRRARAARDAVEDAVVPLFTYRAGTRFDYEGTGILARLGTRYLLLSAAHVLDACDGGVYLPLLHGASEPLRQHAIVTARKPGTTRADDRIDIGFIRLTEAEVAHIGDGKFLDLEHTIDAPPEEPVALVIALGFPARDQRVRPSEGTIQTATTMYMTGPAEPRGYHLAKVDPSTHVLLRYRRDEMLYNGELRGTGPSLRGLSGGGVWPVSLRAEVAAGSPPALIGLVTEQPAAYGPSILVTRAHVIRAFVTRFWAES